MIPSNVTAPTITRTRTYSLQPAASLRYPSLNNPRFAGTLEDLRDRHGPFELGRFPERDLPGARLPRAPNEPYCRSSVLPPLLGPVSDTRRPLRAHAQANEEHRGSSIRLGEYCKTHHLLISSCTAILFIENNSIKPSSMIGYEIRDLRASAFVTAKHLASP